MDSNINVTFLWVCSCVIFTLGFLGILVSFTVHLVKREKLLNQWFWHFFGIMIGGGFGCAMICMYLLMKTNLLYYYGR